jgi:hypothetical protein
MRKDVFDISLYSSGAFKISEMFDMPIRILYELRESIVDKNEKEKQALDKSKGISTTMF